MEQTSWWILETFKLFVLNKSSNEYDKLITSKNNTHIKFLNLDKRISIYVTTFIVNDRTYIVYSYTSMPMNTYVIRDNEANIIVYESAAYAHFVDNIYLID